MTNKWTDTDILERIRIWQGDTMMQDLMEEASDEITRLRTEVEALRLMLRIANEPDTSDIPEATPDWFKKAKFKEPK